MEQHTPPNPLLLTLRADQTRNGIKISLISGSESEETPASQTNLSLDLLKKATCELLTLLNRINRHGGRTDSSQPMETLKTLGQDWFDQLIDKGFQQQIKESTAEYLILHLNPNLTFFQMLS